MNAEAWLRLGLVPAAVWLASLAARRWGHSVSGYLGGMPMIGGPVTLFLALDLGPAFVAQSALFTLAAIAAQSAHLVTLAHVGQRQRWMVMLGSGWTAFAIAATAVSLIPLTPPVAAALAFGTLALAWRNLPREHAETTKPAIPPLELRLRLVAAFVLATIIVFAAPVFGPVVSGILLSLPITGSIMPPFTLALYGPNALVRLVRGFVLGLCGFAAFFLVVATTVAAWGIGFAFTAAVAAAVAALFVVNRLARKS
jgi:hypothetical protein